MVRWVVALLLLTGCRGNPEAPGTRPVRYVRPNGAGVECTFLVEAAGGVWSITSVTGGLTVSARYGLGHALLEARAALKDGRAAEATVAAGKVTIVRARQEPQAFDAPTDVIVTSDPDWSDAFRICGRWNRALPGRQEFPGLWIHPVQPAQRLTFTAERTGSDRLASGLALDRLAIRLRGNSAYVAWVDPAGRMIKLAALPAKPGSAVLLLEGFEVEAAGLAPE